MEGGHRSLGKLTTGLEYVQDALARVSSFLLLLALVVAMINFLMDNELFTLAPWLLWFWAGAQALAVETNLRWVFVLLVGAWGSKSWSRVVIYSVIGILLIFVAVVVTDTEAIRQALGVPYTQAFSLTYVPILVLTWVRSLVAVLLVAFSGIVFMARPTDPRSGDRESADPQVRISTKPPTPTPTPVAETHTNGNASGYERYSVYMSLNPNANAKQAASALGVHEQTVWGYKRKEKANVRGDIPQRSEGRGGSLP